MKGIVGPEVWGVFGTVVTGIIAILVELIRNGRNTKDVQRTVNDIKERLDAHIAWHDQHQSRPFIYLRDREYRR